MRNKFEVLARGGYAARGLVYVLLGGLALMSAIWGGSGADGSSEALSSILQLPFGRIIMGVVAIGLFGHVLWRLAQGLLDADNVGRDAKGVVGRIGSLISAGANVFLALAAFDMAVGNRSGGSGGEGESEASAWLLQQPFGPYLLGIVGFGVVAAGAVQVWKGGAAGFRKRIDLPSRHKAWMDLVCRFGLIARGVLMMVVGGFVAYAAWTVSPEQAGGISDALEYVHELPYGRLLYGLAALGLVAFGGYSIIQGLYRRVDAPTLSDVKRAVPGNVLG